MAEPVEGANPTAQLVETLYAELERIARRLLRDERDAHTLETSALIHEAFLRLAAQHVADWRSRSYFLGAAATTMRRVLVDYARLRNASKRDGGVRTTLVSLTPNAAGRGDALDVLVLDDLLGKLSGVDARAAQVVELRVFGGFDVDETAGILETSATTVKRDWRFAKAWLACHLAPSS